MLKSARGGIAIERPSVTGSAAGVAPPENATLYAALKPCCAGAAR